MGKIVNINEYRPHVFIQCGDRSHVIPASFFIDIIEGKTRASNICEIDYGDEILHRIIEEWYTFIVDYEE